VLRTIFGRRSETEGRGEAVAEVGDEPSSAARLAAKKMWSNYRAGIFLADE
jgi:hypothetical protein